MKKGLFFLCLTLSTTLSYADTCPPVTAIKNNTLIGWKTYDSDAGIPVSPKQVDTFKRLAYQFVLAEWTTDHHSIHCYYRAKNGANLEVYLAKPNFLPNKNSPFWYQVSGSLHCAAGMQQCAFQTYS
jgi:hypothetical protein